MPLEDPWVIAAQLYGPCYIGGWSAAEYWDLTEQIFRTVVVMTMHRPPRSEPDYQTNRFPAAVGAGESPVWSEVGVAGAGESRCF